MTDVKTVIGEDPRHDKSREGRGGTAACGQEIPDRGQPRVDPRRRDHQRRHRPSTARHVSASQPGPRIAAKCKTIGMDKPARAPQFDPVAQVQLRNIFPIAARPKISVSIPRKAAS